MNDLNKVLGKLTYGLYVLTTNNGGCMVDAVCQISSGEFPLISVSVNKNNNTNQLMTENDKFALSIFGMESDPEIIKTYGYNSMKNYNKFEAGKNPVTFETDNVNIEADAFADCPKLKTVYVPNGSIPHYAEHFENTVEILHK
mgnify:CR=1 FL=1